MADDVEGRKLSILLTSYQTQWAKHDFLRNQEWKITYYSLALYAALYAISNEICFVISIIIGIIVVVISMFYMDGLCKAKKETVKNIQKAELLVPIIGAITKSKMPCVINSLNKYQVICRSEDLPNDHCEMEGNKADEYTSMILIVTNSISFLLFAFLLTRKFWSC